MRELRNRAPARNCGRTDKTREARLDYEGFDCRGNERAHTGHGLKSLRSVTLLGEVSECFGLLSDPRGLLTDMGDQITALLPDDLRQIGVGVLDKARHA